MTLRHRVVRRAGRGGDRSPAGRAVLLSASRGEPAEPSESGVRLYLVRHGRAPAGWDDDPDPPLDDVGRAQAEQLADELAARVPGGAPIVSSPLRRCRETAAPLAARWGTDVPGRGRRGRDPVAGGRADRGAGALAPGGHGRALDRPGPRYVAYRDGVVDFLVRRTADDGRGLATSWPSTPPSGWRSGDDRLLLRALDNCSITIVDVGRRPAAPGRRRARGRHAHPLTARMET